jgi:RNA polymerase sigma-70 factor (ECF subfamily)
MFWEVAVDLAEFDSIEGRSAQMAEVEAHRLLDDPAPKSDSSLVRRFRCGEQDAATALFCRYATRLHHLAQRNMASDLGTRFDADDVVQSVFRTFFRRVQTGFYDLPDGEELWRLLLVLALNKIRALAVHHRAQKRDVNATIGQDPQMLSQHITQNSDELALHSLQLVVAEVLDGLPSVQQRIIMKRIDGCQIEEIATETGRSKRTVERVLQSFRQRLRDVIGEPFDDISHADVR